MGPFLSLPGYLPHSASVQALVSADLLLLPLRQDPEYAKVLPGKIFEYLAARRPVLGIGQEDSAAGDLLWACGAGQMADWNREDAMRAFLDRAWAAFLAGEKSPVSSDIDAYSRRRLAGRMAELLNQISA